MLTVQEREPAFPFRPIFCIVLEATASTACTNYWDVATINTLLPTFEKLTVNVK